MEFNSLHHIRQQATPRREDRTQKRIRLAQVYIVSSAVRSRYFEKYLAARELERGKMDVVQKVNDADVVSHFWHFWYSAQSLPSHTHCQLEMLLYLHLASHLVSRRYGMSLRRYPISFFPGRHTESTISIRETRVPGHDTKTELGNASS